MNENLVQHRGDASVWARRKASDPERWLMGGAALVCFVAASRRRSGAGLLLAMAGGALAWWATASGDERRARRTTLVQAVTRHQGTRDVVEDASPASFPASDPPPLTSSAAKHRD
jgi:uncharacterized membrane protein